MLDLIYCVNFCDNKYTVTAKKESSVLVLAYLSWKYLEISESVESTFTKKYGPVRAVPLSYYLLLSVSDIPTSFEVGANM